VEMAERAKVVKMETRKRVERRKMMRACHRD